MTRSERQKRLRREAAALEKRERREYKVSYRRTIALAGDAGEFPSDLVSATLAQDHVVKNEALFVEDGSEDSEIRETGTKNKPIDLSSDHATTDCQEGVVINFYDDGSDQIRNNHIAVQKAQVEPQFPANLPNRPGFPTGTIPWQGSFPYMASTLGKRRAYANARLAADAAKAAGLSAEAAKAAVLHECNAQCDLKKRLQDTRNEIRGLRGAERRDSQLLVDKLESELRIKRKASSHLRTNAKLVKQPKLVTQPLPTNSLNKPEPADPPKKSEPAVLPEKPKQAAKLPRTDGKARTRGREFSKAEILTPGLCWHDFGGPDEIPEFNIFAVVGITSKLESLLENSAFSFTLKHDPTQATYLVSAHALELHVWLRNLRCRDGEPRLRAGLCRDLDKLSHGEENAVLVPHKWEQILDCVTLIRHTATHRKRTNTETLLECIGAAGHLLDAMQDKNGFAVITKLHLLVHSTQEKLEQEVTMLRKHGDRMFQDFDEASRPAEIDMTILDARETICDRLVKQVIHLFSQPKHFQLEGVIC